MSEKLKPCKSCDSDKVIRAFVDLLESHSFFTKREYKNDITYNNESIGYKEEEISIKVLQEYTGLNIIDLRELVKKDGKDARWV